MNTTNSKSIMRTKDRDALIQSLRAGVVPRIGQYLVQVGRSLEIQTLLQDIHNVSEGGSTFRLIIGEYGAGKTFFLNLVRTVAMEKKLITINADLNPDRRLHATGGQARSLYAELMRNMSTRTKPDGGAMNGVVERFIMNAKEEAIKTGKNTETVIHEKLSALKEMTNGFDFAEVIAAYCKGYEEGNETLKNDAIRWLRGEFSTKTDARIALGVRTIIDDANYYDQIKLFARFVRLSGYAGILICLDELVNLFKLPNTQARNSNYEQILRILNDTLQGYSEGIAFILGGTPEFLMDTRRGLYSYPALQSRLAANSFVKKDIVDFSGPVIKLSSLTPEDFYVLLQKIRDVYFSGRSEDTRLTDDAIHSFMEYCANKIGDSYFRTPRTTITSFINMLAVLEQNPHIDWTHLIADITLTIDRGGELETVPDVDDELTTFTL